MFEGHHLLLGELVHSCLFLIFHLDFCSFVPYLFIYALMYVSVYSFLFLRYCKFFSLCVGCLLNLFMVDCVIQHRLFLFV